MAHNPGGGGGSFTKIVRGCACRTSKIWLSLYQFFAKFPTHQYTIFERKAPNLDQIGCFLQQFAQNTPNLCNLGSFVSDENPPIAIPNFAKKCPKRQAHIHIPCQCENPPPGLTTGKNEQEYTIPDISLPWNLLGKSSWSEKLQIYLKNYDLSEYFWNLGQFRENLIFCQ